jgi:DNA-binding transcriptional LysR family regulator
MEGPRMDSLGSLNAFVRAAEARSFTVAGRQLGVSSSAIGKAVARMEERLRVRLLHRSTRSITLTAEAPHSSNTAGASFQKSKRPRLNDLRRTRPRAAHCVSACR